MWERKHDEMSSIVRRHISGAFRAAARCAGAPRRRALGALDNQVTQRWGGTSADDTSANDPAPIAMAPVVIAFASGLAVKPIDAAIETLANALANRLSRN